MNTGVPADRVDATVADGWLTLKSEVNHQFESDAAEAVYARPGLGETTNQIRIITVGTDG